MSSSTDKSSEPPAINSQSQASLTAKEDSVVTQNTNSPDSQRLAQKRILEASPVGDEEEDSSPSKKTKPGKAKDLEDNTKEKAKAENKNDGAASLSNLQNLESTSLAAGLVRVKYSAIWKGSVAAFLNENENIRDMYYKTTSELAEALQLMEEVGAAPVAEDGKVAGNVATRIVINGLDVLIVSKSGRLSGQPVSVEDDFCIVTGFDSKQWSVDFYASNSATLPTSDSPLHHAALHAVAEFHWDETPYVSLHGHALETGDKAEQLGLPCSAKETLFSTPEDTQELLLLLKEYPFPLHKIFVRKGHGFIVLGKTTGETIETFKTNVVPFID